MISKSSVAIEHLVVGVVGISRSRTESATTVYEVTLKEKLVKRAFDVDMGTLFGVRYAHASPT